LTVEDYRRRVALDPHLLGEVRTLSPVLRVHFDEDLPEAAVFFIDVSFNGSEVMSQGIIRVQGQLLNSFHHTKKATAGDNLVFRAEFDSISGGGLFSVLLSDEPPRGRPIPGVNILERNPS
jgi:hypothetical protein